MSRSSAPTGTILREPRQVIAALRVLVLVGLTMLGLASPPSQPYVFWILVIVYALTIFGYLWARNHDYTVERVRWLVFLFDVGMVSALIVLRGDNSSQFLTAYFALVLMAAIADGLGNAFTNALIISTAYGILTRWGTPLEQLITFETTTQFVFFFVVALFMGHMATAVRSESRTRVRAQEALRKTSSKLQSSTAALKVAREALRANDRLATLGMLSAGIAHEMRNPLAAIVGCLGPAEEILGELREDLPREGKAAETAEELVEVVSDCKMACNQLMGVARDLTSTARGGAVEAAPVRPKETIDASLRILRSRIQAGVHVETHVSTRRAVIADSGRLMQVILNLAGNALDAMEKCERRQLTIRAEDADANNIAFVVHDTGPGIPVEVQAEMFEPFFTTKPPGRGTGLGLHVVSEIVKAHGGTIACASSPDDGTRFQIRLPAQACVNPVEKSHDGNGTHHPHRGRRGDDSPRPEKDTPQAAVPIAARV